MQFSSYGERFKTTWRLLKNYQRQYKTKLLLALVYAYYCLLLKTVRIQRIGFKAIETELAQGLTPVFTCPHLILLVFVLAYEGFPGAFLASASKDGEYIASILVKRGFKIARGSSSRKGVNGLRKLVRLIHDRVPIGITFDGPKGPPLEPKEGIVLCAKKTTGSLFFVHVKLSIPEKRVWGVHLKTWDKFFLPLPFARLEMVCEKLDTLPAKNDPSFSTEVIRQLRERAISHYGHLYS